MKECGNCRKVYADDLLFCLDDGTPLRPLGSGVDPDARTEAAVDVGASIKTEVLPARHTVPPTHVVRVNPPGTEGPPRKTSAAVYAVIGLLCLVCAGLAAALVVMNRDRIWPDDQPDERTLVNANSSLNAGPTPVATPRQTDSKSPTPTSPTPAPTVRTYDPTGKWTGQWSTESGTLFDFDLTLTPSGGNSVSGEVKWTMRKTVRPDKAGKVGLSAIEYVRGSYDPSSGSVNLAGYAKDDPQNVLVMVDTYRLKISRDDRTLTGAARNGGKWNGRVDLRR